LHGSLPHTSPQLPTKSHPYLHTRFWGHGAQSGWGATRAALGQGAGSRSPTRQLQGLETLPFNSEGSKTWGCPVAGPGLGSWCPMGCLLGKGPKQLYPANPRLAPTLCPAPHTQPPSTPHASSSSPSHRHHTTPCPAKSDPLLPPPHPCWCTPHFPCTVQFPGLAQNFSAP
jgi:hypothetical protein